MAKHDLYERKELAALRRVSEIKWRGVNFLCRKCSNEIFYEGKIPYSRKCTKCKYDESPINGTLFKGLKFPLHKALKIISDYKRRIDNNRTDYLDSNNDISLYRAISKETKLSSQKISADISIDLTRQKTAWSFIQRLIDNLPKINEHSGREEEMTRTYLRSEESFNRYFSLYEFFKEYALEQILEFYIKNSGLTVSENKNDVTEEDNTWYKEFIKGEVL